MEKLISLAKRHNKSLYVVTKKESYFFDEDGEELKELINNKEVHVYFFLDSNIHELLNSECIEFVEYDDYFGYYFKFNEKFEFYKEFNSLYEEDFNLLLNE